MVNVIQMAKKPKSNSWNIFYSLVLLINVAVAFSLFFSFLAQYINPSTSITVAFAGLFFPYILIVNICFVLFWLFAKWKFALVSVICVLLNVSNIDKYFQLRPQEVPRSCVNDVKVMSFNAHLFGLYDTEDKGERRKKLLSFFSFIKKEQPDFLCFQEYFLDRSNKLNFPTTDSICAQLRIRSEKNYYQHFPAKRGDHHFGYAIFSKYRIVDRGVLTMPDSTARTIGVFVDFRYKNDTLRLYNVHLASIRFNDADYETGRELRQTGLNDPHLDKKAKQLLDKVSIAFHKRGLQVEMLEQHIASCPHPVIVCGDMNDTPTSYAYRKVGKGLKDAFRESGEGIGKTYRGDVFPNYRIDYIFHDKMYNSFGYQTHPEFRGSDHQPISCIISLIKPLTD